MIELTSKLQCLRCRTCGRDFAVDAMAYTDAMEAKSPLFCPVGNHIAHTWNDTDSLEVGAINLQLLAELRQAKHETDRALRELAMRPALEQLAIDDKESKRRVNMLCARSEVVDYGRRLCKFCGMPKALRTMRNHMKTCHRDEIEALSAGNFI